MTYFEIKIFFFLWIFSAIHIKYKYGQIISYKHKWKSIYKSDVSIHVYDKNIRKNKH